MVLFVLLAAAGLAPRQYQLAVEIDDLIVEPFPRLQFLQVSVRHLLLCAPGDDTLLQQELVNLGVILRWQ